MSPEGSGGVVYGFKELFDKLEVSLTRGFDRLDHRIDELNRRLDAKADNTRVAAVEEKLAGFEIEVDGRISPLERAAIGNQAVSKVHRRIANAAVALAASSVGALLYLVASGGVH